MYLEFNDIWKQKLFLLNKAFYHNIIEDSELMRRILMINLGIINDLDNEKSYQYFVNGLIKKANGDADEEVKLELDRVYERPSRELATMFYKYSKKSRTKQLVCGFRTTGGYDDDIEDIIQIFTDVDEAYWSSEIREIKILPISITGIAWEENFSDYECAKKILEEIIYWSNKLGIKLTDSLIDIENSKLKYVEYANLDVRTENLKIQNERLLNFWQRNRLIHQPMFHTIQNDKNGIVEFDITLHQILSKNSLLSWNSFKIGQLDKIYTCPVNAYAIFVCDTPISPEYHPLPFLIDLLWRKSSNPIEYFKKLFKNNLLDLIPKISNYNEILLEFNQDFYRKIFESKMSRDYDAFKSRVWRSLSTLSNNKGLISLFDKLKSFYDLYRLRLVAIVCREDYEKLIHIHLKQQISWRYITITGLHFVDVDNEEYPNMDFPNFTFSGTIIPSPLQNIQI